VTVQINATQDKLRVEPPASELSIEAAVELARDLIDAVTQCGHQVRMNVQVDRQPTDEQIITAIRRVGHMRRELDRKPWHDGKANAMIVEQVLKACL